MPKSCLPTLFVLLVGSAAFAQNLRVFQDDLLDQLVGKWNGTGTVHDAPSKQIFEAEWVLNHQFLRIQEKTEEIIPRANVRFEALLFIGYDQPSKRYVLQSMNVWGAGRAGAFVYGERNGNEIKFDEDFAGAQGYSRLLWQPESKTWKYVTAMKNAKGEWQTTVDLTLTAAK